MISKESICVLFLLFGTVFNQRVSSSHHDWFLRFRSERALDRPETLRYSVFSEISEQGFVLTNISRTVFNPANKTQKYVLDLKLPKTARIVDILVDNHEIAFVNASREDDDISHNSDFDVWNSVLPSEKSHRRTGRSWDVDNNSDHNDDYDEDDAIDKLLSQAVSPVHLHNHEEENINSQEAGNFDVFILPLTIGPRDYVSISVAYGDRMFEDQDDSSWKVTKLFLSPGEIVKSFNVDILLSQEVEVLDCEVVASVLGDITNETVLQRDGLRNYSSTDNLENLVSFNMNTLEQALNIHWWYQAHYFGSSGFYGTVELRLQINETHLEGLGGDDFLGDNFFSSEKLLILTYNNTSSTFSYSDLILEDWNNILS